MPNPKILLFDIETAPLEVYCWGLWDQNIGLEMVKEWTSVLSWSAKWLGDTDDKIMYEDNRSKKNVRDDKQLVKGIHSLLDQADIVITQNGEKFDSKKLNWRFAVHKLGPTVPYRHIDTLKECKKHFAADSNKLAHLSAMLCPSHKKSDHVKFPGFSLWKECLAGNIDAWNEMEKYNPQDVIALEAVYNEIQPWIKKIDFNIYKEGPITCNCGSARLQKRGQRFDYTNKSKYQRYQCQDCHKWTKGSVSLITKERKEELKT